MQVLLIQDVDNLGMAGDVAKVANGYGRNYLLPRKMAILATPGALKRAEAIRKTGEARRAREQADAEAIVGQIGGKLLVFERRASERGQLYGSVTSNDIVRAIQEEFQIEIDRRKLQLSEPLRALGEFDIEIRLMFGVSTSIKVAVIEEGKVYVPHEPVVAPTADAPEAADVPEAPDVTEFEAAAAKLIAETL